MTMARGLASSSDRRGAQVEPGNVCPRSGWTYSHPTRLLVGDGEIDHVGRVVDELSSGPVAIFSGRSARVHGYLNDVCDALVSRRPVQIFDSRATRPTHRTVGELARFLVETRAGVLVAIGGGTVMDVAKMARCVDADADIQGYLDGEVSFRRSLVPMVAVPTTAGTGSEVTPFSVVAHADTGVQAPTSSDVLYPDVALVVPRFSASVPQDVRGEAGLDALCHACEALWSSNASELSDALAVRALQLIMVGFTDYYDDPTNAEARRAMVVGATLAGKAFSNTLTAACEALSYPITRRFGIPHGAACAVTLPAIARLNVRALHRKFAEIARYLGLDSAEDIVNSIAALCRHVTTVPTLRALGATARDLELIAKTAYEPLLENNPVRLSEGDIVRLLTWTIGTQSLS